VVGTSKEGAEVVEEIRNSGNSLSRCNPNNFSSNSRCQWILGKFLLPMVFLPSNLENLDFFLCVLLGVLMALSLSFLQIFLLGSNQINGLLHNR
jgi:hypothetical protein